MTSAFADAGPPCVALLFVVFGALSIANRREVKRWWSRFLEDI